MTDQFVPFHEGLARAPERRPQPARRPRMSRDSRRSRCVWSSTAATMAATPTGAADGIGIEPGDADAGVVVELDAGAFDDLVAERATIFGLLFPGRLHVVRGRFDDVVAWEAALTSVWFDRPIYGDDLDAVRRLDLDHVVPAGRPRRGDRRVPARGRVRRDPRRVHADEIAAFDAEERRLRQQATPDDKRSWWARNAAGDDVCCRLTYVSYALRAVRGLHDDRACAGSPGCTARRCVPRSTASTATPS